MVARGHGTGDGYGNDRPSRARMFWRRQKRLLRPLIVLALLAGGGFGVAAILHDSESEQHFAPLRARLTQMMPLKIAHIDVSGRHLTTEASLFGALGTHVGAPMFAFSVEAARRRIDALPFVDHATIERHLPDTVVINLTERSPVAVWQIHGQFELINRAGERVPDQGMTGKDAEAFMKLPLVVGDGANIAASTLIDALDAQPAVKAFVTAAVRVGERRWNVTLRDGAIVLLPEGHEAAAFARLARYQASDHLLERPVISIDMRLPDRMIIHQAPAPPPPAAPAPTPADTPVAPKPPASTRPASAGATNTKPPAKAQGNGGQTP